MAYSLHSAMEKGMRRMRSVTRPCKPPLLWTTLFKTHEVADPQITRSTSFRADAQAFQKCSSAGISRDPAPSMNGNSSMKRTFFGALLRETTIFKASKASNQSCNVGHSSHPLSRMEALNCESCSANVPLATPVCRNVNE